VYGKKQLTYFQHSDWLKLTWQSNTEEPENAVEGEKETEKH